MSRGRGPASSSAFSASFSASFSLACDLGTTTLACYLVDSASGKVLDFLSAPNPQAAFGADVVSRIALATRDGVQELTERLRAGVENLACALAAKAERDPLDCTELLLAGNSVMELFFWGHSPASLGRAPFSLPLRDFQTRGAQFFGLGSFRPEMPVRLFPLIAGFVGGDTVALLYAVSEEARLSGTADQTRLIVDFGTNGEVALMRGDKIRTCSAAAGPAFEGASIRQGMSALPGAIHSFSYSPSREGKRLLCHTIGNLPPLGLCGTGLVEAVALLLRLGVLSPDGHMEPTDAFPELRGEGNALRCVLYAAEGKEIALYQKDVREFQLAKGALQAAIGLLLDREGTGWSNIDACVLAGAFGSAIRPESLIEIGLLPECVKNRIRAIGNGAGAGCVRALSGGEPTWERVQQVARASGHLRLESLPDFEARFLEALELKAR